LDELKKNKGTQFHGEIVDIFINSVVKKLNILTYQEDIKNYK